MKPEQYEKVSELIGTPKFIGLSSYVLALRRNLIILSFVIITYKLSGAEINTQDGIILLGIPFKNFASSFVDKALIGYLFYSFLHYIIEAWEGFAAWRIRLTGVFNSSLPLGSGFGLINEHSLKISDIGWGLGKDASLYSLFLQAVKSYERELESNLTQEKTSSKEITKILELVEVSLYRFQRHFRIFQWYQVIRFFLIDIIFPCSVFVYALYLLTPEGW